MGSTHLAWQGGIEKRQYVVPSISKPLHGLDEKAGDIETSSQGVDLESASVTASA